MAAKRDFTDRFLKSIKPAALGRRLIFWDAQIPGFGIRVTDRSGDDNRGTFVLVTRFPGSTNPAPRRIGDYPAMSLAKAREIAREWREDIRQGFDPKAKQAERRRQRMNRPCGALPVDGDLGAFGRALRFMLVTGQRRSEVGKMTWGELDMIHRAWALSRARTKADRAHEIPLSDLAMSIIGECPKIGDFVFSTGRSAPARAGAKTGARPISGWSRAKTSLDKVALKKVRELAEERGEEAPPEFAEWHLHDLRRTAATNLARLGVDRVVIGKVLNHAEQEVTAVYDRHRYEAEKRRALELWGQRLAAIVDGSDGRNVLSLALVRGI